MRFNPALAVLAFASTAALASFGAQASSIDLRVIGTITPGSCVPTLNGGAAINLGNIASSEVDQANFKVLPERAVPFSISCTAPTKVALRAVDNRFDSVVPGAAKAAKSNLVDLHSFGLGKSNNQKVGSYLIILKKDTFTDGGVALTNVYSENSGTAWLRGTDDHRIQSTSAMLSSWSSNTGSAPTPIKDVSGTLAVQVVLNKGQDLTLTSDVPLDGLTTIELVYL